MENACVCHVTLSDEEIRTLTPFVLENYSAHLLSKQFSVIVREKAFTEAQWRKHILNALKRFKISPPKNKHWLQTIPEQEAREFISNPARSDSRLIVLPHKR